MSSFIPLRYFYHIPDAIVSAVDSAGASALLDDIGVGEITRLDRTDGVTDGLQIEVLVREPVSLVIPGVNILEFNVFADLDPSTQHSFDFSFIWMDDGEKLVSATFPIEIVFKTDLLRPALVGTGAPELDTSSEHASMVITPELTYSTVAGASFSVSDATVPPMLIGETGFAIEATGIQYNGDPWLITLGSVTLYLPEGLRDVVSEVTITDAQISDEGFSGTITWTATGDGVVIQPLASAPGFEITVTGLSLEFQDNSLVAGQLAVSFSDIEIEVPGADWLTLVISSADDMTLGLASNDSGGLTMSFTGTEAAIRISGDLVNAMEEDGSGGYEPKLNGDGTPADLEINLGSFDFSVSFSGGLSVSVDRGDDSSISIPPFTVGESGIVLEGEGLAAVLDGASSSLSIGLLRVHFTEDIAGLSEVVFQETVIDSTGFTGLMNAVFDVDQPVALLGFAASLEQIGLRFEANVLTGGMAQGTLALPYFDDPDDPSDPVRVKASFSESGAFSVALAAQEEAGAVFEVELGPLKVGVRKFLIEKPETGEPFIQISAQLVLEPDADEPLSLELEDLRIYADGTIELPGGWFDLRDKLTYDQNGFKIGITRIGLGIESGDGGEKWIGFSGALALTGDLPAGVAVEGVRFIWWKDNNGDLQHKFTVAGIGFELTVPELFYLGVRLGFFGRGDPIPFAPQNFSTEYISGLTGDLQLQVIPVGFGVNGSFMVGRHYDDDPMDPTEYFFWFAFLEVNLPTGIPLGYTGIAIYGFAGLITQNMIPSRSGDQEWYRDWYRQDPVGVTSAVKWMPESDAFGVGIGVTLGTSADNGLAFSAKALMVASFPGPTLMLTGKANLLTPRSALSDPNADPLFQFLVVFDGAERSLLFALEVSYSKAKILEIGGITEVYFDFDDPGAWHLYVGEEPEDRRVSAEILSLFGANAYLMLNKSAVAFGFFIGYRPDPMRFGPLEVKLALYVEASGLISWDPQLYSGSLGLYGEASISAFGVGLGLSISAEVEAAGPDPWLFAGEFKVKLNLPWPLPDPSANISLRWEEKTAPSLETPLSELQFDRHAALKSSETFTVHTTQAAAESGDPVPMDGALTVILQPNRGQPGRRSHRSDTVEFQHRRKRRGPVPVQL